MSTSNDAWQEWADANPDVHDGDTWPHRAFMAGYRRALEDAADALHYPGNEKSTDGIYEKWLRDRADRVDAEDGSPDECPTCGATGTHDCRDYLSPNGQTGE